MTLTTHAAAGMIVAQWTNSILIGFIFALASHYLLDAVPHGDEFIYWRFVHNSKDTFALLVGACDLFVLIIVVIAAINSSNDYRTVLLIAGVLGGVIPDALVSLYTKRYGLADAPQRTEHKKPQTLGQRFLAQHYTFHMFFHNTLRIPIPFRRAIAYQTVFLVGFVYFFLLH